MEEYLQHMKTLRTQMNDVEDQAAKISFEEQMQITTFQNLEKDLYLAKSDTNRLKEDFNQMAKEKGQICSQILENQRKISALESDSSTLSQTMELIQQERVSLSSKLVEKSIYYTKVAEDIDTHLQEQQEWINSYKLGLKVKDKIDEKIGDAVGRSSFENHLNTDNLDDDLKDLMKNLDGAKAKFDLVTHKKSKLVTDNSKVRQSIELVRCATSGLKSELKEMDRTTLEEELQALLSDKAGETEYLNSLHQQIDKLKGLSHMVKCDCGKEYKVELDLSS